MESRLEIAGGQTGWGMHRQVTASFGDKTVPDTCGYTDLHVWQVGGTKCAGTCRVCKIDEISMAWVSQGQFPSCYLHYTVVTIVESSGRGAWLFSTSESIIVSKLKK